MVLEGKAELIVACYSGDYETDALVRQKKAAFQTFFVYRLEFFLYPFWLCKKLFVSLQHEKNSTPYYIYNAEFGLGVCQF